MALFDRPYTDVRQTPIDGIGRGKHRWTWEIVTSFFLQMKTSVNYNKRIGRRETCDMYVYAYVRERIWVQRSLSGTRWRIMWARSFSISLSPCIWDDPRNAGVDHAYLSKHTDAYITVDRGHATVTEVTEKIRLIDRLYQISIDEYGDDGRWTERLVGGPTNCSLHGRERVSPVSAEDWITYLACQITSTASPESVMASVDSLSPTSATLNFCRAMLCISAAIAGMRCLSVRPSVCLSRSWVAPKRIKVSSKFFHHRVATPF